MTAENGFTDGLGRRRVPVSETHLKKSAARATKLLAITTVFLSTMVEAATVGRTYIRAELSDVIGRVAGRCMNEQMIVTGQSANGVTCQMPLTRVQQAIQEIGGAMNPLHPPTTFTTYIQFNMAQVGDDVEAQARSVTVGGSSFDESEADKEAMEKASAIFNSVAWEIAHENQPPTPPEDVSVGNLRFVDGMASSGQCNVAQRFAATVKDPTLTEHVNTLCPKATK